MLFINHSGLVDILEVRKIFTKVIYTLFVFIRPDLLYLFYICNEKNQHQINDAGFKPVVK